nr:MAG TPA: hypothetical protein [Caudoviricetes sp.]DAP95301.1 MAG TPA: hypothetical protein [Caudoviricetes sp.]
MAEITNEQKLYVLLDNIRDKSEYEQEIWGIIYDHVSPDDAWKESVAELLVKSAYLDRGYAYSNQESRVVYSITKQGRRQIPILWNGSVLKKEFEEEVDKFKEESKFRNRHKNIAEIIKLILAACVGALAEKIADFLF